MIIVAVGLIYNANGDILVSERANHKHQGGAWEFPGGKVEENETVLQALQRELKEELDIEVLSATPWWQLEHDYSGKMIFLDIWKVNQFTGEARGQEGQAIRWVSLQELSELVIPDANRSIVEKLLKE